MFKPITVPDSVSHYLPLMWRLIQSVYDRTFSVTAQHNGVFLFLIKLISPWYTMIIYANMCATSENTVLLLSSLELIDNDNSGGLLVIF